MALLGRTCPKPIAGLPFLGPEASLTDVIVHGQDMRRPLGIDHEFTADQTAAVCLPSVGDANDRTGERQPIGS